MTAPWWASDHDDVVLHLGDCLGVLRDMPADSVDAIVTDPPAGIAFMDREWDDFRRARNLADAGRDDVFGRYSGRGPEYGRRDRGQFVDFLTKRMMAAYRVLKPGGHALVWSIPRTSHWTAWAVEDAGFDLRDCIPHLFGSGFPKSRDVSKAIAAEAGAVREVTGSKSAGQSSLQRVSRVEHGYRENLTACTPEAIPVTAPATADATRWDGWGTALKPGQEMWWLARKPLDGTVAANVLRWGTGALNIDGGRVAAGQDYADKCASVAGLDSNRTGDAYGEWTGVRENSAHDLGRWPANILLTHSAACDGQCAPDCPVGELDRQSGTGVSRIGKPRKSAVPGNGYGMTHTGSEYADTGGASRFYPVFRYAAKAPSSERPRLEDGAAHETVKSLGLMRWLTRLITPPGGTVLDLFAGSGATAEACVIEGFRCVLIEKDLRSARLIRKRLGKDIQPVLFGGDA